MSESEDKPEPTPSIRPLADGPLLVKGVTQLEGEGAEAKPVMSLCRCGRSSNKPFCDGSHKKVEFRSDVGKPAGKDRQLKYEGEEVDVFFNPMICAHAAECNRIASHIFDATKRPWVQPNNGSRKEIESVIAGCPSGALTVAEKNDVPKHRVSEVPKIRVAKNGPYWVESVALETPPQGEGMSEKKYVLCRCGQSGNKPFCDGTHRDIGWVAE